MKTKINAKIVQDSLDPRGNRLTSLLITFPRFILAEINTHRMLSKNTSSSRAIPFKKMVESVENDPFIPIAWQKNHKGMQGSEYITDEDDIWLARANWLRARDYAIDYARHNNEEVGVTKQLCNRLLEPFMWTTMLITGSKEGWDNFFELRNPVYEIDANVFGIKQFKSKKDAKNYCDMNGVHYYPSTNEEWLRVNKGQAEIHMMALAECIYDAMNESTPEKLQSGEWHIPFKDKIYVGDTTSNKSPLELLSMEVNNISMAHSEDMELLAVKISTAMSARTSYTVVGDEKEIDYEKMLELHDRLIEMRHDSPLEHCARAMSDDEFESFHRGELKYFETDEDEYLQIDEPKFSEKGWSKNYKGFMQYRYFVENSKTI